MVFVSLNCNEPITANRKETRKVTLDYAVMSLNCNRLHPYWGYMGPLEFEIDGLMLPEASYVGVLFNIATSMGNGWGG